MAIPQASAGQLYFLNGVPTLINSDSNGALVVPTEPWLRNAAGVYVPVGWGSGQQSMPSAVPLAKWTVVTPPAGSSAGAAVYVDLSGSWIAARARAWFVNDTSGATTSWAVVTASAPPQASIYAWTTNGGGATWEAVTDSPDAVPVGAAGSMGGTTGAGPYLQITPAPSVTLAPGDYTIVLCQQP